MAEKVRIPLDTGVIAAGLATRSQGIHLGVSPERSPDVVIDDHGAVGLAKVSDHGSATADAIHVRLDHGQGEGHRHGGIHGVSAALENIHPDLGGERMVGCNHSPFADGLGFVELPVAASHPISSERS